jgi:hypothetical protein
LDIQLRSIFGAVCSGPLDIRGRLIFSSVQYSGPVDIQGWLIFGAAQYLGPVDIWGSSRLFDI